MMRWRVGSPKAVRNRPSARISPLGVSVTLSHYCPTASRLLFDAPDPLRIVEAPPAFPPSWPFEGLDARDSLPPLLRPGVLASWPALERWEEHAVAALADDACSPEEAVARLADDAERARTWQPERGGFEALFDEALAGSRAPSLALALDPLAAWDLVASTVSPGHPRPQRPASAAARPAGVAASEAQRAVRRWLAARAFASWLPLQGSGLRTTALGLAVALAVLRAEETRDAQSTATDEAARLEPAIRRADLLLVHLADPQALAARLAACEQVARDRVLASILRA